MLQFIECSIIEFCVIWARNAERVEWKYELINIYES